jgi:hypothetical protein
MRRNVRREADAVASCDRGVSEVLSYSLIFGLIVTSIAVVTVGGVGSLQSAQANEQLSNAERAFGILQDNLADVHSEGAPSRATEVSLGTSELFFADNVTLHVGLEDPSGDREKYEREFRPIVFRVGGDRQIVYEAGAVVREERQGGLVLNEPPFSLLEGAGSGDGRAHVQLVSTTAADVQSMGSTTVLVRGQATNREVLYSDVRGSSVLKNVTLETPRYAAWANYFERQEYCSSVTTNDPTVRCHVASGYDDPGQLFVSAQAIEVELID